MCCNNYERRKIQDNECINKYTDHRYESLLYRMVNLSNRMSVRCRTHTSFVGEQSTCNTLCKSKLDRCAGSTADDRRRCERSHNDRMERIRDLLNIRNNYDQRTNYVESRHNRNDQFCNLRNTSGTA